jgi:hypothetical protein
LLVVALFELFQDMLRLLYHAWLACLGPCSERRSDLAFTTGSSLLVHILLLLDLLVSLRLLNVDFLAL